MSEYGVRITVVVEQRDEAGKAESLTVDFAEFVEAATLGEAAALAVAHAPSRLADVGPMRQATPLP